MRRTGPLSIVLLALPLILAAPSRAAFAPPDNPPKNPPGTTPPTTKPTPPTEVGGKTLAKWVVELKHSDPSVRENAIKAMPHFGSAAAEIVPQLLDRCLDEDACPRVRAVVILRSVEVKKDDIPKVVAALDECLRTEAQAIVRYEAAVTLLRFGKDSRGALQGLLRGAGDRATFSIRQASIAALKLAGLDEKDKPKPEVTQKLLLCLKDPAQEVRLEAALALGQMGKPPQDAVLKQVVKALLAMQTDDDKVVQIWSQVSAMALDKVTDQGLDFLVKYLKDPELEPRVNSLQALGTIGPKAKAKLPNLIDALKDKDLAVANLACQTLVVVGEGDAKVLAALSERLKDPKPEVRSSAVQAYGTLGEKARSEAPKLIEALKDEEPAVVVLVCQALVALGDAGDKVIKALTDLSEKKGAPEAVQMTAKRAIELLKNPPKTDKEKEAEKKDK
jgi:HEAT repeat protein